MYRQINKIMFFFLLSFFLTTEAYAGNHSNQGNGNTGSNGATNITNNYSVRLDKLDHTQTILEFQGRIYDSRKVNIRLFASFSTTRSKVDRVGIKFLYKFGKSYEEKRLDKLEKILDQILMENEQGLFDNLNHAKEYYKITQLKDGSWRIEDKDE